MPPIWISIQIPLHEYSIVHVSFPFWGAFRLFAVFYWYTMVLWMSHPSLGLIISAFKIMYLKLTVFNLSHKYPSPSHHFLFQGLLSLSDFHFCSRSVYGVRWDLSFNKILPILPGIKSKTLSMARKTPCHLAPLPLFPLLSMVQHTGFLVTAGIDSEILRSAGQCSNHLANWPGLIFLFYFRNKETGKYARCNN